MTPPGPLPSLVLLTDRRAAAARGRTLVATVAAAVGAGARAVLLREKDLAADLRGRLAGELARVIAGSSARLGIASDARLAARHAVDWVHLAARDPWPGGELLVGRSCHGEAEVFGAAAEGCGYVTLSPVAPSTSKAGYGPPLGAGRLAQLCRATPLAVYALGGVDAGNAASWVGAGARGVAVMGGVMGAPDPAAATRRLLDALHEGA